jgi:glycosyltransferase involved in cell wall biosynthesis
MPTSSGSGNAASPAFALATAAAHRLLAWPRYDRAADLHALASTFGPALAAGKNVCLCLRHDPTSDGPQDQAVRALEATFVSVLGELVEIEILLVDNPLDDAGWGALGKAVTGVLALPSSSEGERAARLARLGHPFIATGAALLAQIGGPADGDEGKDGKAIWPRVTAIVSTYKSAAFMRGCLEDLVAQTLYARGELEILVIDSGSPENEGEIVREMQRQHPSIRYIRTERETLYAAWNRGVRLARAAYLTNANTDDRHRNDALELMADALDAQPDVSVVYADSLITTRPHETFRENSAQKRLSWPPFSYAELQRRCIIGPQPMWRRALHDRYGDFEAKFVVAGDYEFWLRIGRHERFLRLPEVLGLYFQNGAGLEYASGRTTAETLEVQRKYATVPATVPATVVATTTPSAAPSPAPTRPAFSKAPVVSVIVPTHNRPEFLKRALASLEAQTFADFEVIVINDAGEPIESVLAPFRSTLNITYVRHGVNRDRAAARNTGLCIARGKYIAYLDDDDRFRPDHLATLVDALKASGRKVAYSDAIWLLEEKSAAGYRAVRPVLHRSIDFDRDRLLSANYIPILSVLHERACIDEIGGFDEDLMTHEDWELFIRLSQRHDFIHVAKVTAEVSYRQDGSNTTSAHYADFERTMRLIHERYRALSKDRPEILARQARVLKDMFSAAPASATAPAPTPPNTGARAIERAERVIAEARALRERGDLNGAAELLSGSIELAAHSVDLLLAIADVFVASKQIAAACQVLEEGSILHPIDPALPLRLAEVLVGAGDFSRARIPAQKAASLGNPGAEALLASIRSRAPASVAATR